MNHSLKHAIKQHMDLGGSCSYCWLDSINNPDTQSAWNIQINWSHMCQSKSKAAAKSTPLTSYYHKSQVRREIMREEGRALLVQVVLTEHMSEHASSLVMWSVKLNFESTDMIKLSLIWQAHSSPGGRFLCYQCQLLNLFCWAALIGI